MKPLTFLSNASRAKDIFAVLVKHGFANLVTQLDPQEGLWKRIIPQPSQRRTTWERIRLALEELGPTFVKAGQLMSMRPDALPHALIFELRKLQNSVTPLPFSEMSSVLIDDLEVTPAAAFLSFNETAIASASLAQVYFATLHDGREVAVKIQRPNLLKTVQADLDLLTWFAQQLHNRVDGLKPYDLPSVVAEVKENLLRELDFRHEARNQQYFNALNPHPDRVYAPFVVDELSGEHVLVMERISGVAVGTARLAPAEAKRIAANGAASLIHQVLIAGFFHADPHAGNVLVTPDGRLCFLDWGMAGNLTRRLRLALADLFIAAVQQDAERIVQIAADLGSPGGRADLRGMERDVTLALREDFNSAIGHVQLGRAMLKLLFIFGQNGINITRDYSLMAKAVLSIEEVARTLDPDFDLRAEARPILTQLQKDRTGPLAIMRESRTVLRSLLTGARELPAEIFRIIRRIEHDDLTIKFQHQGLEDLDDALKTSANRIALGFISGCLFIGSSLIVAAKGGANTSLSIAGYVIAMMLAAYVAYGIYKEGKY
ncbi:ABC1 kinase family protein [Rariglobus hedericola]|uniref:AarF/ABC1/UbiB kinase family protein n=1 Tax=Rariglobus hedericola TaxID=2597822 RepID=A0A556QK31_9BACT|nr:AarF/UbiB family protein [Rariglobus hedericola]TSJ76972.1 AarF/ABC1/UbiB kinase family protein [Rariglobus hedericola]